MSKNKIVNKGIIVAIVVLLIGMTFSTSSSNQYAINSHERHITEEIPVVYEQFKTFKDAYSLLSINSWDSSFDIDIIFDVGYSVKQTVDGGYIVAGYTESFLEDGSIYYSYALLVKFDADGNEEWNKTFKGLDLAIGTSVQNTLDNGYILTGYTAPKSEGNLSVLLIKTDDAGNKEWEHTFQIMDGSIGYSVQQMSSGGYVISGMALTSEPSQGYVLLIKTDNEGNILWNNTYISGDFVFGSSVQETSDGGYIIGGTRRSFGYPMMNSSAILVKTNSDGTEEWNHIFTGNNNYSEGWSVQQVNDTGYILSGATIFEETDNVSVLLLKIDIEGNETWNKTFSFLGYAAGTSIQQTNDDGYIITGTTGDAMEEDLPDVLLFKTDYYGNEEWNKTFEFNDSYSVGISLDQTTDDGYILTGYMFTFGLVPYEELEMDGILIKTDSNGTEKWNTTFEGGVPECLVADAGGPYVGNLEEDIQFEGNASGGIRPYSFLWDFGDGNTSEGQNATHMYNATGNYTVTLFVTDYMGKIVNDSTEVTVTYDDTIPPIVEIVKPEKALYIYNKLIMGLSSPFIIGGIDVVVNASDSGSGLKEVRFYIDGQLKKTVNNSPYEWTWNERIFFGHTLSVEALDNTGNKAEDSMAVFVINMFPHLKFGILKGKVEYNGTFGMRGVPLVNITAESISDSYTKHTFTKIIPGINMGNFTLRLPSGTYMITVEKDGFITQQREVEVILGDNEFLHFELEKA